MRDQDPEEMESQQLIDEIPDALPRYMKMELRRRTPEQQRLYLLGKLAESRADLVKEVAVNTELRKRIDVAQTAYLVQADELTGAHRELAQARILWQQNEAQLRDGFEGWKVSAEKIIAAQRAEIARLEAAHGTAREQVDAARTDTKSWQEWGEAHKARADAAPDAVAALQVRTGDRVAVLIPEQADEKTLGEFQAELATLFPGVEIIVKAGVTAVLRTGDTVQTARSEDGRT